MDPSSISAIADTVTAVVALLAGLFAAREYRRAGRWKGAELAATHLHRLATDERLAFACHALDWGVGPIPVPSMYRTLAGKETVEHSVELLKSSLTPNLDLRALSEKPEGFVYRHCFDQLFAYLDGAQELLDLELVDHHHLRGLRYWLEHLGNWRYAQGSGRTVFIPFLIAFGYGRVLRLFESLTVPVEFPPDLEQQAKALIERDRP